MIEKKFSKRNLLIPTFGLLDPDSGLEVKTHRSFSFSEENTEALKDNKLLANTLHVTKNLFDNLTTPRFNNVPTFSIEQKTRTDESYSIDEYHDESERIHKVKVTLCNNTNKINIYFQQNEIPIATDNISFSQDDIWVKRNCSSKNVVCGCSII